MILDVGAGPGYLIRHLDKEMTDRLLQVDSSGMWLVRHEAMGYGFLTYIS